MLSHSLISLILRIRAHRTTWITVWCTGRRILEPNVLITPPATSKLSHSTEGPCPQQQQNEDLKFCKFRSPSALLLWSSLSVVPNYTIL
ncbi:hypothetical protein SprV_0602202200 [Sparganum proliferum]